MNSAYLSPYAQNFFNDYLYQIGIDTVDKGYYNSSSSTVVDLPQEIQNQIKHLYNEDYQLLKNNRKKTWLIPQQLSLFSRVKQKIVQAFNTQV